MTRYDPDTGRYRCEPVPVFPSATPVPADHVCVLEYDLARCASYCPECGHVATDEQLARAHTPEEPCPDCAARTRDYGAPDRWCDRHWQEDHPFSRRVKMTVHEVNLDLLEQVLGRRLR